MPSKKDQKKAFEFLLERLHDQKPFSNALAKGLVQSEARNGTENVDRTVVRKVNGVRSQTAKPTDLTEEGDRETPEPKPFVKWAGGKRQLMSAILPFVPANFRNYHEPFVGGGALFFALSPPKAFLSDSNDRLIRCYKGIKKNVGEVISTLQTYRKSRRFFLELRKRDIDKATDVEVAAWFIFLNKTGFNGLYRVNSKNRFNVPYGDNRNAQICDPDNLRACSRALQSAVIAREDFKKVEERAQAGDLVYFDPPYVPLSTTSYFTAYTARGFTQEDQIRLRDIALRLKKKGVHVLLSNSSSAAELYSRDFAVTEVMATRLVNSKVEGRGKIAELLIR